MQTCAGKAIWRVIPGFVLGLVLVACGGQSIRSPEQVHAAWLEALRNNEREQVLSLLADTPGKDIHAHAALTVIQGEMNRPVGDFGRGGPLLSVRALNMDARGAGRRAWSRWQYAKEAKCHVTDLAQTPQGWRVVDFSLTDAAECRP